MTKEELAELMNGKEQGQEITVVDCEKAARSRLVAVFGWDDDQCIIRGAINDRWTASPPGTIFGIANGRIIPSLVLPEDLLSLKRYGLLAQAINVCQGAYRIELHFAMLEDDNPDSEAAWEVRTNAPHEKFMIFSDGDRFCRGAVFDLDELE